MSEERNPLKDTKEMLGDFLREVAALVVIFIPLEVLLKVGASGWRQVMGWVVGAFGIAAFALWYGVQLERSRSNDDGGGIRNALGIHFGRIRDWCTKYFKKTETE